MNNHHHNHHTSSSSSNNNNNRKNNNNNRSNSRSSTCTNESSTSSKNCHSSRKRSRSPTSNSSNGSTSSGGRSQASRRLSFQQEQPRHHHKAVQTEVAFVFSTKKELYDFLRQSKALLDYVDQGTDTAVTMASQACQTTGMGSSSGISHSTAPSSNAPTNDWFACSQAAVNLAHNDEDLRALIRAELSKVLETTANGTTGVAAELLAKTCATSTTVGGDTSTTTTTTTAVAVRESTPAAAAAVVASTSLLESSESAAPPPPSSAVLAAASTSLDLPRSSQRVKRSSKIMLEKALVPPKSKSRRLSHHLGGGAAAGDSSSLSAALDSVAASGLSPTHLVESSSSILSDKKHKPGMKLLYPNHLKASQSGSAHHKSAGKVRNSKSSRSQHVFRCAVSEPRVVEIRSPADVRPTEPDEEFRICKEDVLRIYKMSCSVGNFGWRLANLIFNHDELWEHNWGGTHGKRPLSPRRLHAIEHVYNDYFHDDECQEFLSEGRSAINQGLRNMIHGHAKCLARPQDGASDSQVSSWDFMADDSKVGTVSTLLSAHCLPSIVTPFTQKSIARISQAANLLHHSANHHHHQQQQQHHQNTKSSKRYSDVGGGGGAAASASRASMLSPTNTAASLLATSTPSSASAGRTTTTNNTAGSKKSGALNINGKQQRYKNSAAVAAGAALVLPASPRDDDVVSTDNFLQDSCSDLHLHNAVYEPSFDNDVKPFLFLGSD